MKALADNIADEELFDRVRERADAAAFQALYERHSRRLYSYCLRVTGDREVAQDLFQQVFTNVFEHRDAFKGGNFAAWIMTITRNQCLMWKRGRKFFDPLEKSEHTLSADYTSHHDSGEAELIAKALQELSEEFREVIELRFFEDLQYEEISEILGISLSLVKVRLYRAKKELATSLASLHD